MGGSFPSDFHHRQFSHGRQHSETPHTHTSSSRTFDTSSPNLFSNQIIILTYEMTAPNATRGSQRTYSTRSASSSALARHEPSLSSQSSVHTRSRSIGLSQTQRSPQQSTQQPPEPLPASINTRASQAEIVEAGAYLFSQQWIPKDGTVKYKELINALIVISSSTSLNSNRASDIKAQCSHNLIEHQSSWQKCRHNM